MHHTTAPVQAIPIILNALFLVLFLKYRKGEVMDQYRSKDRMNRLNIDAVEAV
jgi:hypothetical protein